MVSTSLSRLIISSTFLVSLIGHLGGDDSKMAENVTEKPLESEIEDKGTPLLKDVMKCSSQQINADFCPSEIECAQLGNECVACDCSLNCRYGEQSLANCSVPQEIECKGERTFQRPFICAFCYQSEQSFHNCEENVNCDSISDPYHRNYLANCTVDNSLICLGKRHFHMQKLCNWTGGHRWITALILSITLGGFGADR